MSDHLIGELANESTQIDGTITGKDQSISGSLNPSAQTVEAREFYSTNATVAVSNLYGSISMNKGYTVGCIMRSFA